jgi:mannose-6-phosphate isomerase class I
VNYDKFPVVPVSAEAPVEGWTNIGFRLASGGPRLIAIECYPGADVQGIERALAPALGAERVIRAADFYKPGTEITFMLAPYLGDDPVFGRMNGIGVEDFLAHKPEIGAGRTLVIGTGASLLAPDADLLVYADMARWEIQNRFRRGEVGNLGAQSSSGRASLKYKRAFFVDWRAADRLKKKVFDRADWFLDTNDRERPKLVAGDAMRRAFASVVKRPFRVVPFFDPGLWGGQWMRRVCDLPKGPPNYAWCFDCVPEENSILLGFGGVPVEMPAIDVVFFEPRHLLGDAVHARFGTEFPIRFDFLDTMDGGNLSLQVHPLTEYIQDRFGMHYTQDESYYILDAAPDACTYLGLKNGVHPREMMGALERAQNGGPAFPAECYVNRWPANKHDHFLIPGGTIHCAGRNVMVLEISATPYIFTFKLWDWDRVDLDGRPRPIHLEHGRANIQWDRATDWVRRELINRVEPVARGEGWCEERTGLHLREFIETRRHWFHRAVAHDTRGGVNVLNLVEGEAAIVESPGGAFNPFTVHYAETFIVPASVGEYTVRPAGPYRCATMKAFVRTGV